MTLEALRHGLVAAAEQMATSIRRAARSQVIREMLDYSTAIFDPRGGIIAQSTRIPIHLNSMSRALEAILRVYPVEQWVAGDIFSTNDPYSGGQHLPDIQTFAPVFWEGQCIAIAGTLGHHLDVGGRGRGSYAADATEIYQEGFRIPPVRIIDGGKRNELFFKVFAVNIRVPEKTMGDLDAQIAALSIGVGEVTRLVKRYGTDVFLGTVQQLIDASDRRMRAALLELPEAPFFAEDIIDGDGLDDEPLRLRVRVERRGDTLEVDFEGTSPQVRGPINCPVSSTESAVYYAVTASLDPGISPNYGAYRPIKVIAPEGSVVNPLPPAPVVGRMVFSHRIACAVMAAIGQAVPERAVAPYYGNSNVYVLSTRDDAGRQKLLFEIEVGGWGARQGADGPDCLSAGIHNLANTPIEMVESEFPLRMVRYGLREDSAGLGKFRGGLGAERSFVVLRDCELSAQFDRVKFPVPGVLGGSPGAPAKILVERDGAVKELPGKLINYPLRSGDRVVILTQGGGGLGTPAERPRELVAEDLLSGKIGAQALREAGIFVEMEKVK
ncbi:MAG: hydantoinase B/oxoprolinase family protein [bacterium]|nr:hydantoinase B/oxoprolinase family protein [bacterium]